jgi:hypothetical protein
MFSTISNINLMRKPATVVAPVVIGNLISFGPISATTSISKSINVGSTWSAVANNTLFSNYGYHAATNGTGTWIAGGAGTNYVAKSTDFGTTWSPVSATFAASGFKVAYGNNIFVASGGSGGNTGVNVVTFNNIGTKLNTYSGFFGTYAFGVTYFSVTGKWYVGGTGSGTVPYNTSQPLVVSSDNTATSWSKSSFPGLETSINSCNSNSTHIVISGTGTSQSTMISTDGINWTPCIISGTKLFGVGYQAAYGEGTWIAVGTVYGIARSTDNGSTWAYVGTGILSNGYGIAYCGNSTWIAVGSANTHNTAKSTNNGLTWTGISNTLNTILYGVAFG